IAPRPRAPESVELLESAEAIRADWDALADRTGASPFLRPGWIEPWQDAFGSGEPAYLVTRREGSLAGVLPLQRRRGTLVSAANWHTPLYGPVVEDRAAAGELARGLLAHAGRRADLWFLDPEAPGYPQVVTAAGEAGYGLIARTIAHSPYVPVEGSFDDYMGGLDRKIRKEIGRRWRRIREAGQVEAAFEDGSARLDELLADGFRLEGSGWKEEQGSAISSNPEHQRFYTRVARWAAERGWLRLAFLRLDGTPIAFDFGIEADGVFYVPKGGFDVEHRKLGPGQLLTHASIERAFELGLRSYELLGQQDEYKRQWTAAVRERVRVQAFPRRPAGTTTYIAWRYGRPLVRRALRREREDNA
ncbi:MAG: GNAT family N-acetyltransferase, partial [Actinomycetota bacterium]|nr:GNAT family N-acetyltransferase [Actinomycetota bacterium]